MLDRLRQRIGELVVAEASRLAPRLARTIVLVASPRLAGLLELRASLFPGRSGLAARLSPWIVAGDEPAPLRGECGRALVAAFDAGTLHDLTLAGFEILDQANQLLLVADLAAEDGLERAREALGAFEDARQAIGSPPFARVGIFLLKRPVERRDDQASPAEPAQAATPAALAGATELAQGQLDRAFFLCAANSHGTLLASAVDLDTLALHLVQLLAHELESGESPSAYFEWLRRSGAHRFASGASGFSIALPAAAIVETVAARRAADLLEDSLLQEPAAGRADDFARSWLHTNHLSTLRDALESLSRAPDLRPIEPLAALPDVFAPGVRREDCVATLDAVDASLPRCAEENEALFAIVADRRANAWRLSLEDHVEELIGGEPGGLRAAPAFLDTVGEHLGQELRIEPGVAEYAEPAGRLRALERLLARAPEPHAVWLRAALLAVGAGGAVAASPVALDERAIAGGAALLISVGLALFVNHLWAERLGRAARAVEKALHEKWGALRSGSLRRLLHGRLAGLGLDVRRVRQEVEAAVRRVPELVEHWRERHAAPAPVETACHKPILRERAEMAAFEDRCHPRAENVVDDYLDGEAPLRLWRRLAPPGEDRPNAWETALFEEAALRILPDCAPVAAVGVADAFVAGSPRFAALRASLVRGAQPFLTLSPEGAKGERTAVLEGPAPEDSPAVAELLRAIEPSFAGVRRLPPTSPHRISFFGLLEDVDYQDIRSN